jgi:leucyl aminopeptidase
MVAVKPDDWEWSLLAIGWGLGAYKFTRYLKGGDDVSPKLVLTDMHNPEESRAIIAAINTGRDLINTPAGDMGPEALHAEVLALAHRYEAQTSAVIGDDLLTENYPMIHAVGRAAHEAPRLVELLWGDETHPKLTLVGKGITFDTGGLNIKSAAGARIMKKDMGGAAHALALADMVMAANLPVRLHVLIAIAENAISAGAYRPGDVLNSRAGLTVEIDNTDAEGRLVLGDALTKGAEQNPDMMIDFATLTGAARVALGPTLPPYFTNRPQYVEGVMSFAARHFDPLWHMPLWQPYHKYLSSPIADMKNSGSSFAGSVTAALFLSKFVQDTPWMHFDVFGWNPSDTKFGRAGGELFAVRALYRWIKDGGITRRDLAEDFI